MAQTQELKKSGAAGHTAAYATLLVHVEPGKVSTGRVKAAAGLARELGARLVGLGAETFDPIPTPDPFTGYAAGEWVVLVQEQIAKDLEAAEAAFKRDAEGADIEWRSVQDFPARAIARMSRMADLVVASPRSKAGATHAADPADLVMTTGRPVLVVPDDSAPLRGKAVVVAWKNTRECRRAVADAMPFLVRAEDVIVEAVCRADEAEAADIETADVVASLKRRGVNARPLVATVEPESVPQELQRVADLNKADLIVAGAYGHSRFQEWAFGGVTDELLHRPGCYVLLSH